VRAIAAGVTPRSAKTNRYGRVTFKVRKLLPGKTLIRRRLSFRVAKTGYLPATCAIKIRY